MAAHLLVWTFGLWWYYRAAMWLKARRTRLRDRSPALYYLGGAVVALGLVLDVLYNVVAGTILFLDPPRELTFTARLKRYRRGDRPVTSWRYRLATWICRELLNPHDPSGEHC